MSGSMLGLGNWYGNNQGAVPADPLSGYAAKMKAALGNAAQSGGGGTVQSPLVAAYTPPAYQTTPAHVDINAVIAAMNAAKGAGAANPMAAPGIPSMMPAEGANNGPGDVLNGDAGQNAQGATTDPNVGGTAVESVGYAHGGPVTAAALAGPNPAGPDAGYAALQPGEYVIKKAAAAKVGPKALGKINEGDDAIAKKVADRVSAKNDRPVPGEKAKK